MILFFSGTGNSEYVADRIGKETGDTVLNLFEKIRAQDHSALQSDKPWVIVTPTLCMADVAYCDGLAAENRN